MVNNDPHNRKQPFILGMIALVSGILLALFVLGKVRAAEPELDNYDYCVFIRVAGQHCYFSDYNGNFLASIPTIHNNQEAAQFDIALDDLFSYINPNLSLAYMIDDHAAKGPYEYIRDGLAAHHVSILEFGENIFPVDVYGFSLKWYSAGMYEAPVYVKNSVLSPTPSPSPTSVPEIPEEQYFFLKVGANYYCFTFNATNFCTPREQLYENNSMLSGIVSEFSTGEIFENQPIILKNPTSSNGACLYSIYFTCDSFEALNYYICGTVLASTDLDFVKANYSPVSWTQYVDDRYQIVNRDSSGSVSGLHCISFYNRGYQNGFEEFVPGSFDSQYFEVNSQLFFTFDVSSYSTTFPMYYVYLYGLNDGQGENPNPSPTPSVAPPTPTEAPHVNINWPSGTPSPTPPFSVPGDFGSGSGSSSQGSLSPGQVSSTLNTFKQYTENNGAFAFLYACTSVIPDEALYFLFILLFVLLLIAVIRLFVHYGG